MLHKFFGSFRTAGHPSGFEVYFRNIQKVGIPGAPSVEEAQQDYRRLSRSERSSWFLFL